MDNVSSLPERGPVSENPAPYWIHRVEPYYSAECAGWVAAVVWVDASTRHELRAEARETYSALEAAREASAQLARDDALRERLLAEHPIDYERYWRERAHWS